MQLAKYHTGNDMNKMTTKTLHTVIQYKYKHYEKWACFLLIFVQNVRGASATRNVFCLFEDMGFWYLRWMSTINNCVIVLTAVPWYWRTLETFGTGLMHNINKCKQTSQWFTNQTEDIIVSYDLTHNIPPPMHYTIVLNFHILHICYILLFLISLI